jgi:hypothetical protein
VGWIETDMYWKVNHMVVPKANALACNDCHGAGGWLDWKAPGYAGDPLKRSTALPDVLTTAGRCPRGD